MLDEFIKKSSKHFLAGDLEVFHSELTKGRRSFALHYILRKVEKLNYHVYGVGVCPGKYIEGEFLKGFKFKVKRSTIYVVCATG